MDRLEQIKNTVAANGMREWTDERVNQVAREYATEIVRHNLERAAEQAKVQYFVVGEKTDVGELTERVDKESILKLEIELI